MSALLSRLFFVAIVLSVAGQYGYGPYPYRPPFPYGPFPYGPYLYGPYPYRYPGFGGRNRNPPFRFPFGFGGYGYPGFPGGFGGYGYPGYPDWLDSLFGNFSLGPIFDPKASRGRNAAIGALYGALQGLTYGR